MQQSNQDVQYDLESPKKPGLSTFTLIAGGLGGLILVSLLCLGGWYGCVQMGICGSAPEPTRAPDPVTETTPPPSPPPSPTEITITITNTSTYTATSTFTLTPSDTPTSTVTFTPTSTATITAFAPTTPSIIPPPPIWPTDIPPEYKEIQLPPQIIEILQEGGLLLPLPREPGPLQGQLKSVAGGYDLSRFDLNRTVNISPALDYEEYDYIAVPTSPEFYKEKFSASDFGKGVLAGLVYDKKGAYSGNPDVYEIWVYEDHVYLSGLRYKSAILLQQSTNEYFWTPQDSSSNLPLSVFVKNGCWLCWRIDKRCGCVICKK
jgi:hypothetical protein